MCSAFPVTPSYQCRALRWGLRGKDVRHNNDEPLEWRRHALTKSRVLVRIVPSCGSAQSPNVQFFGDPWIDERSAWGRPRLRLLALWG